ncbi:MAG: alanine racemase [Geminicoccaceae bacterium]|nr:alanine racemase [Geminicoccaceae bacterium]
MTTPSRERLPVLPPLPACAEVDLGAVVANWRRLKDEAPGAETAAVLKAGGYGLGAAPVAKALRRAGCRTFYVARVEEGLALRADLGPTPAILVLEGALRGAEDMAAKDIVPVLNQPLDLEVWSALARKLGRRLPAVLHLDTGMSRLGFSAAGFARVDRDDAAAVDLRGLLSHLVAAEGDAERSRRQRRDLMAAGALLPGVPLSLANSSGMFLGQDFHLALCRPGIALFGGNPTPGRPNPMRPVLRLTAPVLQVRRLDGPASVGYGATHAAPAGSLIATVGIGYADGYLRCLGGRSVARIDGVEVPVVGRVSMDLITVDATALDAGRVRPGVRAELVWGDDGVDRLAEAAGTIAYEVLTRLGPRIERRYLEGDSRP